MGLYKKVINVDKAMEAIRKFYPDARLESGMRVSGVRESARKNAKLIATGWTDEDAVEDALYVCRQEARMKKKDVPSRARKTA